MDKTSRLCLNQQNEIFVINLDDLMCFEADDHYTTVHSSRGNNFMVPFTLGRIEEKLKARHADKKNLMRLGRKYIINTDCIYHMNVVKQTISLTDYHGKVTTLDLSKTVLRSLVELVRASDEAAAPTQNETEGTLPPPQPLRGLHNMSRRRLSGGITAARVYLL